MLGALDLTKVLVLDIETVPQYPAYDHLPERWKDLWGRKAQLIKKEEHHGPEHVYNRAGIYAEFGKIVCISCGFFSSNGRGYQFRVKSYYNDDEATLLKEFCALLDRHFNDETSLLCAHNGKEFDYPYISRRCVINKVPLPAILNLAGKKPWQVNHLDTMELWKFGDYKSYTSLDLLAASMDIPTPKDDMDGSQVGNVYWVEKDLERIKTYCQKDIITVARLLLHFSSHSTLEDTDIVYL